VLAVGDGHNDFEMLEWAGRGVAMGHAPDRVKHIADDVTGSIEQDGLAQELSRYL
ncbi:MAG: HAD family hydrolase, partial [Aeromicrobium sp.]